MLFFKFFALLGALVGIYAAAALQNGPDVADANLCKLLRRFSSEIPDQCIRSLDNYGTAFAVIFVLACVILLLWDFRKHVLVSTRFSAAVKRLWAKMEPSHIIILGLVIAALGLAWQLYRGPTIVSSGTGGTVQATMTTGPRPDEKDVISNLQSKLDDANRKLADALKKIEPATPPRILEKKPYTRVDLEKRQEALEQLSVHIDSIDDAFKAEWDRLYENWPDEVEKHGLAAFVKRIAALRDKMERVGPSIQVVLNRLNDDDLKTMTNWHPPEFNTNFNLFIETIENMPPDSEWKTLIRKTSRALFTKSMDDLSKWMSEMRSAIAKKRAEYRLAEVYK